MTNEVDKQVEIARRLDTAAIRCLTVDMTPATRKQIWFLAHLMLKAEDFESSVDMAVDTSYLLTMKEASSLIDTYKGSGK